MGAAYLLVLAMVCTVGGLLIRELWHTWREADREYVLAKADEKFAREHRVRR